MEQVNIVLSREEFRTLQECLKDMRMLAEQIWTPDKNAVPVYEQSLQEIQSKLMAQAIALSTILLGADIFAEEAPST